jgi:hypothetical protein
MPEPTFYICDGGWRQLYRPATPADLTDEMVKRAAEALQAAGIGVAAWRMRAALIDALGLGTVELYDDLVNRPKA